MDMTVAFWCMAAFVGEVWLFDWGGPVQDLQPFERELRRWTDARQRGCGVTCDSIERPANLLRHGGREDHRFAMLIIFHEKTDTTIDPFCSPIHFQSSSLVSSIVPRHQETVSEDCVFLCVVN